ncbi:protein PLASTID TRANSCRIPTIONALLY ACTIVE 12, chloroplastic isoform X2 [Jatropha curcas]|uniref:protein PLASTID TRANSCRIPTIONALLY ACTIVE 12, chloroplastic isoform X2 n=1 Tax=Jatropha curcas TaxID=180498 RepID=UPI0005FB9620|nr:protein PLASTID TRANSCRIPTIONALLY ACTIVE 12, chloroplastic isoform X2 [Jatropha curcas]
MIVVCFPSTIRLHNGGGMADRGLRSTVYVDSCFAGKPGCSHLQTSFVGSFSVRTPQVRFGSKAFPKAPLLPCIKCEKKDEYIEHVSVERPPYHSYMDSTSGQLEPASGARASIPGQEYWPEGTADRVRAARAPEPTGTSTGSPSYGEMPGSRRKKYRTSATAPESSIVNVEAPESIDEMTEEPKDVLSDYVVYQTEPEEEQETGYDLDKKLGRPHPFIDPKVKKPIEGTLTSEELWWNWRKPEKEQWSRWQRRKPDVETVFLKAMAETGQVKLHGEEPTLTETALYRARKHLFKEERLRAEHERLEKIGPMAYYSEWVKAWKGDTSQEAIQKHFEETGEDENTQLIEMFCHQTDREYRIMMGTDIRIKRDPLAMRMREDLIKQIWGGDPVYPTINYIQDPDEIIDYRGPDFHEPTPNMLAYLKEHGKIVPREEFEATLAKEKTEQLEMTDMDEAMAQAVDIGENDDGGEDTDVEEEEEEEEEVEEEEGEITRNWSVLKSTPQIRKSKAKPKKKGSMSLEEAVEDSENLTDFLMDFGEEE